MIEKEENVEYVPTNREKVRFKKTHAWDVCSCDASAIWVGGRCSICGKKDKVKYVKNIIPNTE